MDEEYKPIITDEERATRRAQRAEARRKKQREKRRRCADTKIFFRRGCETAADARSPRLKSLGEGLSGIRAGFFLPTVCGNAARSGKLSVFPSERMLRFRKAQRPARGRATRRNEKRPFRAVPFTGDVRVPKRVQKRRFNSV